jgi:putative ABC transport system permease protein
MGDRLSTWLAFSVQDLEHAYRVIAKRRGFAIAVMSTLALGIGANTAMFALVRAVVLNPLPYEDSDRLYSPFEVHTSGRPRLPSYPTFLDWRARTDVFDGLAFARGAPLAYQTQDASGLLLGSFVTADFFELLGVPAELGRVLTGDDFQPGADGALVLSHRAWRRWFGSDAHILGRTITVDALSLVVVGVMPPLFAYPDWGADNDLWIAMNQLPSGELAALEQRGFSADSRVLARLQPDLSLADARDRLVTIAVALAAEYPETHEGWTRVQLRSLKDVEVQGLQSRLFLLWGAVIVVLLICCLNLANLYLVHGASRQREYAIRVTLGAGRLRVMRQMFTESALMVLVGGAAGLLGAAASITWVKQGPLAELPRIAELTLDGPAVAFAGGISLGIVLLFTVVTGSYVGGSIVRLGSPRSGERTTWAPTMLSWVQSAQVGATFVLLIGAWLLGSSLFKLSRVDPGYDPHGLVLVPIHPPSPQYDAEDAAVDLYSRLIQTVERVPGVTSVGLTNHGPGGRAGVPTAAALDRVPDGSDDDLSVLYRTVSDGFFQKVGIDVLSGREFVPDDLLGDEGPVIINETLAARWGGSDPVGERLGVRKAASSRVDFGEPMLGRVIGVVANLDPAETDGEAVPIVYVPFTHSPWSQVRLLVRTNDSSADIARSIEAAVREVDPAIPLSGPFVSIRRVEDIRAAQRSDERFNTALIGGFAFVALLLALIGIYGVVSYTILLRTRAIGIRLALGATPERIVRGVVLRVGQMTGIGLLAGGLLALVLSRSVASVLYEVSPLEWSAYTGAATVLTVLSLVAGCLPARRAGRLDPARVLREH